MTNFTNYPTLMGHRTLYDFIVANRKKQDSGFPLSDMYVDDEGNSVIEMALAGYKKENIEIKTENNDIIIESSGIEKKTGSVLARRKFKKVFVNYDNRLDLSSIAATFQDGLLKLTIPLRQEAKSKTIVIQ